MLKLWIKHEKETGDLYSFKASAPKRASATVVTLSMSPGMWSLLSHPVRVGCPWGTHFWAWKGSDSNFTEERPGRQHLSLGSRLTPPGISNLPYCDMTRGAFNLCGCLSKIYNPCLIMRKHQTIPKWGAFYKMPHWHISKTPRPWKTREVKETWQPDATEDPGVDCRTENQH